MTLALCIGLAVSLLGLGVLAVATSNPTGRHRRAVARPGLRARLTGLLNTALAQTRVLARAYGGAL